MPVILGQTASLSTFPLGVPEALRLEGEGKIILMNYIQKTVNREGSAAYIQSDSYEMENVCGRERTTAGSGLAARFCPMLLLAMAGKKNIIHKI